MIPHPSIHPILLNFATSGAALIVHPDTPPVLRRLIIDLTKNIQRELPNGVLAEIEAARTEAVIKAAYHLRLPTPDS